MDYTELPLPRAGDAVVVGLSGGVDSCVAAVLLKERGCRVTGVTMSHWNAAGGGRLPGARHSCYDPGESEDIEECAAFCKSLGIGYHVVDTREAYKKEVLDYFTAEYRAGRTPNPCVQCNRRVKFGALLDGVRALGVEWDYFCTGHYAAVVRPCSPVGRLYGCASDRADCAPPALAAMPAMLRAANDGAKDQSYFLYRLPSAALEKTRFPLAGFTKQEVRRMARERGLAAAERSESQDFVPPEVAQSLFGAPSAPGDFVAPDGTVLGRHRGIERYTVGQRRGLGLKPAGPSAKPLYVRSICGKTNRVALAEEKDLYARGLVAEDAVWPAAAPDRAFRAGVKIRAASKPADALVTPLGEGCLRIIFDAPQRAVAPGQSAVAYIDGVVVCGGIIREAIYETNLS